MEIIKKKKKKNLVLYSLSFTNLTSEERTLEFYDINNTPFVKEFDDLSDELFICHKPLMFINTRCDTIGFMVYIKRCFVSLLRKRVWQFRR